MGRDRDSTIPASERGEDNGAASQAALKTSITCLAFVLAAQLVLVCCAWKIPALRAPAVVMAIILFAAGLLLLRWLMTSVNQAVTAGTVSRAGLSGSEATAFNQLLDDLQPLFDGDLRVRAAVSEPGLAGTLGKTVNHLITELRWLVGRFEDFGSRIDALIAAPRIELRRLRGEYREQAGAIHESANALAAMTSAMSSLSAATRRASSQAHVAAHEADRGATIIVANEGRVERIREEAGNTAQILQRLVRTAASVDARVASIIEVARRAELLALNSTLQATTKASANVEFIRLTEEVSELAAALSTTSSDVASGVGTMQEDATEAMAAMTRTNRDLFEEFDQLDELGGTLDSVKRSSTDLCTLVDQMAEKTLSQTSVVKRVYSSMVSINDLSDSYTSGARAWSASLDELQTLALELRSSVADFQLPQVPPVPVETAGAPGTARGRQNRALTDD